MYRPFFNNIDVAPHNLLAKSKKYAELLYVYTWLFLNIDFFY